MAKGKRKMPKAVTGGPKEKHRRKQQERLDPKTQPRPDNVGAARATVPAVKSKHHSYFEFVENKGHKKKKLEFQVVPLKLWPETQSSSPLLDHDGYNTSARLRVRPNNQHEFDYGLQGAF